MTAVFADEVGVASQWQVRWWTTNDGPHAGTEAATFRSLPGPNFTELFDVDPEVLVASADKLVGNNKKLPAATIKEAKRVLQSAVNADYNGEVICKGCKKDEPGKGRVKCGCCPVVYHWLCAPGFCIHDTDPWWCPDCKEGVAEEEGFAYPTLV